MIHLDTSFLIRALVVGSTEDCALRGWLTRGEDLGMSTIAWAEFLCGPVPREHLEAASALITQRLPFGDREALRAAELFNASGRRRGSFADCMIAATAQVHQAGIATANPADFRHFEQYGLTVVAA